jgi:hypothetical protein
MWNDCSLLSYNHLQFLRKFYAMSSLLCIGCSFNGKLFLLSNKIPFFSYFWKTKELSREGCGEKDILIGDYLICNIWGINIIY